jgi:hypothetical protein
VLAHSANAQSQGIDIRFNLVALHRQDSFNDSREVDLQRAFILAMQSTATFAIAVYALRTDSPLHNLPVFV